MKKIETETNNLCDFIQEGGVVPQWIFKGTYKVTYFEDENGLR